MKTVLFLLLISWLLFSAAGNEKKNIYGFSPLHTVKEGELSLLEKPVQGKKYMLLIRVGKGSFPLLYVDGDEAELKRWKGRYVKIGGRLFWEKDLDRPVLRFEKLEPACGLTF